MISELGDIWLVPRLLWYSESCDVGCKNTFCGYVLCGAFMIVTCDPCYVYFIQVIFFRLLTVDLQTFVSCYIQPSLY